MKTLTLMSTVMLPLTFIAGVYGMNFKAEKSPLNMPELDWYWGYPAALGLMLVVALAIVYLLQAEGLHRQSRPPRPRSRGSAREEGQARAVCTSGQFAPREVTLPFELLRDLDVHGERHESRAQEEETMKKQIAVAVMLACGGIAFAQAPQKAPEAPKKKKRRRRRSRRRTTLRR